MSSIDTWSYAYTQKGGENGHSICTLHAGALDVP